MNDTDTDYIGFRDAELRKRLQEAVTASNGMLSMADFIRAALDEKLTQIETQGIGILFPAPNAAALPPRAKIGRQPGTDQAPAQKRRAAGQK